MRRPGLDLMGGGVERPLPLEFCTLEAVEGGTLVRFTEFRRMKVPVTCFHPPPPLAGDTWKGDDEEPIRPFPPRIVAVPYPVAIFCDTPGKLLGAIERARKAFEDAEKQDPGEAARGC